MWRSQSPRPAGKLLTRDFCTLADDANPAIFCAREPLSNNKNYLGQEYGGRASILATAIGEESFPDKNGNGRFDESEYALFLGLNVSDVPYDLKEAFVDHNEDGFYNPEETIASFVPVKVMKGELPDIIMTVEPRTLVDTFSLFFVGSGSSSGFAQC